MDYSGIPDDLRALKQWGLFRKKWIPERKRYEKYPIDAKTGKWGKSNDPSTWTSFKEALAGLEKYHLDGLAFYFKPPYIGIDIDHVRDEMEQYIGGDQDDSNIVADFIQHTHSYTESSVSQTGIHIIVKGQLPGPRRRKSNVEMYPGGRFFALTGQIFGQPVDHIHTMEDQDFKYLYQEYIDADFDKVVNLPVTNNVGLSVHLSETEVIEKASNSTQGELFKQLMDGNWQQRYTSHSEADQALCNILAFWTAKDRTLMDSVFRQSKLYRPKWDAKRGKQTYGELTITRAINDTVNVYQPQTVSNEPYFTIKGQQQKDNPLLKDLSYTDTGLRNRFLKAYPKVIRYDGDRKKFMRFNGQRWQYVNYGTVSRMLDPVVQNLANEKIPNANKLGDDDLKAMEKSKRAFIRHSKNNVGKRAALNEVANFTMTDDTVFDQNYGQLNTPSGLVDLSTGEVRDTTPADLVTKITNAEILNQPTPIFGQFMHSIFPDHPELISFVMRLIGYTILGTTAEQRSVFLLGTGPDNQNGSNGKSTLVQLFFNVLGDYAVNIQPEVITANQKSSISDSSKDNQLANTKGTRLITTSEMEQGAILSEATLKRLTGNETITARRLYESPIQFMPTGTLWMTSNYMPTIQGTDNGIWRRLITIPMTAHIVKKDVHLMDKLLTEKAGILRQIIDGAIDYENHGLQIPQVCLDLAGQYREEMDTVALFLDDCFEHDDQARMSWNDISEIYDNWQRVNGVRMSKRKLNRELGNRLPRFHGHLDRGFKGIKPKTESGYIPLDLRVKDKKRR